MTASDPTTLRVMLDALDRLARDVEDAYLRAWTHGAWPSRRGDPLPVRNNIPGDPTGRTALQLAQALDAAIAHVRTAQDQLQAAVAQLHRVEPPGVAAVPRCLVCRRPASRPARNPTHCESCARTERRKAARTAR